MIISRNNKSCLKKAIAAFMLLSVLNEVLAPTIAFALTAGPTMPEATNFEPVDTTDMVNPLSGSFTYNAPLLEVPGPEGSYPLSLAYHGGVTPDEEASWVGLGWSLNPGAISRNVNGYPDDWNAATGSGGYTTNYWSGGKTTSYSIGIGVGFQGSPASVNFGLQFASDTYRGFGVGVNAGFSNFQSGPFALGGSVGISPYGGGYAGLGISYAAGSGVISAGSTLGLQTNFHSVSGSVSTGVGVNGKSILGASISTSNIRPSLVVGSGSASYVNNQNAGKISTDSWTWGITIPIANLLSVSLGYTVQRYWSATTDTYTANGVLNQRSSLTGDFTNTDDDNYSIPDPINSSTVNDSRLVPGGNFPNFDDYNVTAQGLGGSIRPYIFSSLLFNQNRMNNQDHTHDSFNENFPKNATPNPIGKKWQFRFVNDLSNDYRQQHPWVSDEQFAFDANPQYGNNDGNYGYEPTTNRLEGTNHIEYFTNDQINSQYAASRGFIDCKTQTAGFTRAGGAQIGGFMITNASGVTYHYALPAYSSGEQVHSQIINSAPNGFSSNDVYKNTPYAYTWYLTAITGPDYISRGTLGTISSNDWGYWVKFDYGHWALNYAWQTPLQGMTPDLDNQFQSYSRGLKDVYYLDAVETRTHTAIFEKEIRADGQDEAGFEGYSPDCVSGKWYSRSSLRLNNIYLFQNDQLPATIDQIRNSGTLYQTSVTITGTYPPGQGDLDNPQYVPQTCSVTDQPVNGQNVIDKYDITPDIVSKCLRKISFNYDYSLAPGVPNNDNDPGGLNRYFSQGVTPPKQPYGKLTLLSVDFQGKGGVQLTPPTKFNYDLDRSDPANQGSVAITQVPDNVNVPNINFIGYNQPGVLRVRSGSFNVGDILTFQFNGKPYYCTLLSTPDNGASYNVLFLYDRENSYIFNSNGTQSFNSSPGVPALNTTIAAFKTKNPPYNYNSFDSWHSYKSDFVENLSNVNLSRATTPVSSASADVWSLHSIESGVGATIDINYEGNTYNSSVLNKNPSVVVSSSQLNSDGTMDMNASVPANINLSQFFNPGDFVRGPMAFYYPSGSPPYSLIDLEKYPQTKIVSITGNTIKVQLDPALVTTLKSRCTSCVSLATGNLIPNVSNGFNYGGGVRVKDITVDDHEGNVRRTAYDYSLPVGPAGQQTTSGVTSYLPSILDQDNFANVIESNSNKPSSTDKPYVIRDYQSILYKKANYLLALSRVAPAPGVLYEWVAVREKSVLPNGSEVPVEGSTVYQYEVFKPEMVGIKDYFYEAPTSKSGTALTDGTYWHTSNSGSGYKINKNTARDFAIKDYTSRVGNLKRVITFDNLGNKLTEKVNHYLHDDLDNTTFNNQISNFEPRLSAASFNGVSYNNMGVMIERYATARANANAQIPDTRYGLLYDELLVMSNRETYPTFLTGTTQYDYKNGTKVEEQNLGYDFYTGAVNKKLVVDSYGNRFITQTTPAYMAGGGTVYPALGLKTHDDVSGATQHKQMLTQQASTYTFSADASNTPIGVVSASVQTWSNTAPVVDETENVTTTGQSNIWRADANFSWLMSGTSANNTTPYASFVDYFASGGASNAAWKQTGKVTKYNVYSAALEGTDINNNYATTHMGYGSSKVIVTGTPARFGELAYSGAEDAVMPGSGNFSSNIAKGGGTVITDTTLAHTGIRSLSVPGGTNGFTYSVPVGNLNPTRQNYSVAVWVKPVGGNINQAQLYYQCGTGAAVTASQSYGKSAAGWYLLEMTVPSGAITSGNLVVGCKNASASGMYFDDFRFQPTASSSTAYVYDTKTAELNYVLDNNNIFTRYQYDGIGRLVRVYKEVIGKSNIPLIEGIAYNYAKLNTSCAVQPPAADPSTGASQGTGSFVTPNPMDYEWKMEAPPAYSLASDDGSTINAGRNSGINAGRFAYFSTAGTTNPVTYVNGTLSFSAKGSGTIEVQLLSSYDYSIQARKTFALTSTVQAFNWTLPNLLPQQEMIAAIIVNGGNSSQQATVQFQNNFNLSLNQLGFTGTYTRFRADQSSLIGNAETNWYGWSDAHNGPAKKYLQHSAYARMRFQTAATQIAIEYVRDFYDRRVINLFAANQTQNGKVFDGSGNLINGTGAVNNFTQVTGAQVYTISGLLTTNPTIVWYQNGIPLGAPVALQNQATAGQPPLYQVTAPGNATTMGLFVQNSTDTYLAYSKCMVQQGAIGSQTPLDGIIPSAYSSFSGYVPSHISGPAIFINGVLYKYYQVEGTDIAKKIQFLTDNLPAGSKTVEVMMPGQGTYLPEDPHVRRAGTYLRAVYFPGTTTTVSPSTTVAPGSIVYIHDSILSGYNISSDAQNNVWMMMTQRSPGYGFTGDIFSEGYAGRILGTDIATPALTTAFAKKLASFGVDKYWFQIGVNDFGFNTPLPLFYTQYKSLIEQLKVLRPNAKFYIQSTGPESYEGPNGETMADDGLSSTGPSANDFRDVQRALATSHAYCEYVDFENLFPASAANLADGIHPTDAGNVLYANGIKNKSTLLGTVLPVTSLAFYRSTSRHMIQSIPGVYTITATGGKAPYTFTRLSGNLPDGVTFNPDGTITGSPATGGAYPLSVRVTDANGASVTQSFTLPVDFVPTIAVGPQHLINARVNTFYSKALRGYYGYGPYKLALTSGSLPAGMTFDSTTGILSGTPTVAGTAKFTITATDHYGFQGSTQYTLVTGMTTPPGLTDNFTVTATVDANNHLWLTGHLNDMYSQTLFTYLGAYFTPAGNPELYLKGDLVNVAVGLRDGIPVDMGPMGLLPGNFNVRVNNGGISPATLDGVTINYDLNTAMILNTSVSSPQEQLTPTAVINAQGHLIVTTQVPNPHTLALHAALGAVVTQNGSSTWVPGPVNGIDINPGSLSSAATDFGVVPANSGSVSVQIFIGGISPSSLDGKVITFNSYTNFNLTKP